jgi:hypothetical protein
LLNEWQSSCPFQKDFAKSTPPEPQPQSKPKLTNLKRLSYLVHYFHKNFSSDLDCKDVLKGTPELIMPKSNLSDGCWKQLESEFPDDARQKQLEHSAPLNRYEPRFKACFPQFPKFNSNIKAPTS